MVQCLPTYMRHGYHSRHCKTEQTKNPKVTFFFLQMVNICQQRKGPADSKVSGNKTWRGGYLRVFKNGNIIVISEWIIMFSTKIFSVHCLKEKVQP